MTEEKSPNFSDKIRTFCAVQFCNNNYINTKHLTGDEAIYYFRCPKNSNLKELWNKACQRTVVQYVCSKHFPADVMVKDESVHSISLVPGSVPSLLLPVPLDMEKVLNSPAVLDKVEKNEALENIKPSNEVSSSDTLDESASATVTTTEVTTPTTSCLTIATCDVNKPSTSTMCGSLLQTVGGPLLKAVVSPQGKTTVMPNDNIQASSTETLVLPTTVSVSNSTPITSKSTPKSFTKIITKPMARKSTVPPILKKPSIRHRALHDTKSKLYNINKSKQLPPPMQPIISEDKSDMSIEDEVVQLTQDKGELKIETSLIPSGPKITEEELLECLSSPKDENDVPENQSPAEQPTNSDGVGENEDKSLSSGDVSQSKPEVESTVNKNEISSLPTAYVLLSKYDIPPNTTTVILPPESRNDSKNCCLKDCKNEENKKSEGREILYHPFPKDAKLRRKWANWAKILNRTQQLDSSYICSDHFTLTDYKSGNILGSDACPSKRSLKNEEEQKVVQSKENLEDLNDKRRKVNSTPSNQHSDLNLRTRSRSERLKKTRDTWSDDIIEETQIALMKRLKTIHVPVDTNPTPIPSAQKQTAKHKEIEEYPKNSNQQKTKTPKSKLSKLKCSVEGCLVKPGEGFHFYPYPNEKTIRATWLTISKHTGSIVNTTAICAKHFSGSDFVPEPGTKIPSSRLRRGSIPSKFIPSLENKKLPKKKTPGKLKRKLLKETSSEDEDPDDPEFISKPVLNTSAENSAKKAKETKSTDKSPKKPKLGKKIEIIAELDEDEDGKAMRSYKVVIKKIRRKGAEGERRRGLLMDCKNSLLLVKKIVEGLDIRRMKEVKFKPGDLEESEVVLTATAGETLTTTATTTTVNSSVFSSTHTTPSLTRTVMSSAQSAVSSAPSHNRQQILITQPQVSPLSKKQPPLLLLKQVTPGQSLTTKPTNLSQSKSTILLQSKQAATAPVQRTKTTPLTSKVINVVHPEKSPNLSQTSPISIGSDRVSIEGVDPDDPPRIDEKGKKIPPPEEVLRIEEEMSKCKLAYELQRYKDFTVKQDVKINTLKHSKEKLEKSLHVLKKTLELVKKDSFMCVLQNLGGEEESTDKLDNALPSLPIAGNGVSSS